MTIPVLLIVYNRPELTRRSLQAIAAADPDVLMVAADGPSSDADAALCDRTREVIQCMPMRCPVEKHYAEENLGCGVRVYTAIDWALSAYESVIVLEDDCIASRSFFSFCRTLLAYYRDNERVMHISGNNFLPEGFISNHSYHFSKYPHAWGWATWRRAWKHFDHSMAAWPKLKADGLVKRWCSDPVERRYWSNIFDRMHQGAPDIWDYHWTFACWAQGGLSAIPRVNLVSNVGTGPDATHTSEAGPFFNLPAKALTKIFHPQEIMRDEAADAFIFDHNYGGDELRRARTLRAQIRRRLPVFGPPYRFTKALYRRLVRSRG